MWAPHREIAPYKLRWCIPISLAVALTCQLVVLPAICYGLVVAFGLQGALAVGMMILVAAPGGITANLFSHLAGGDVALNITLTAINSLLSAFVLPVVVALATWRFMGDQAAIGLQLGKFVQVLAIVLIPVGIGLWTRHRFGAWAVRMHQRVSIASAVVLVLVILGAVAQAFDVLAANLGRLGGIALLLSTLSLTVGYVVPRLFRVSRRQAIASAMEIGIHNVTVAIIVAVSVIGNEAMAAPAAVYGVLDNRFRRVSPEEPRTNLGGEEWANEWPVDAAWDFVALGRGHDAVYWSTWLASLYAMDPDMWVNIEHEDVSLGRIEGLQVAAGVLLDAARRAGV